MSGRNESLFRMEPDSVPRGAACWGTGGEPSVGGARGRPQTAGPPGAERRHLLLTAVLALPLLAIAGPARATIVDAQVSLGLSTGTVGPGQVFTLDAGIDLVQRGSYTYSGFNHAQNHSFQLQISLPPEVRVVKTYALPLDTSSPCPVPADLTVHETQTGGSLSFTSPPMGGVGSSFGVTLTLQALPQVQRLPGETGSYRTLTFSVAGQAQLPGPVDPNCQNAYFEAGQLSQTQTGTLLLVLPGTPPPPPCQLPAPTLQLQPQAGPVSPGERVHYQLTAGATPCNTSDPIQQLTIQDTLPDSSIATLVPGSVTQGGHVSGNTISWSFSTEGPPTVAFDLQVKDAQHLPPGATAVLDSAHAQATAVSGKTAGKDAQSQLTLGQANPQVRVSLSSENQGSAGSSLHNVYPGDTVTYSLAAQVVNVPSDDPVQQLTLVATLPDARLATLAPDSVSPGGVVSGNTITWKVASDHTGGLHFAVKLKSRDQLQAAHITEDQPFSARAEGTAVLESGDHFTNFRTDDRTLKLRGVTVTGVVRDIVMSFPNPVSVDLSQPVQGATVRLIKDDRPLSLASATVVDETISGPDGLYLLTVPEPGNYLIEVDTYADQYLTNAQPQRYLAANSIAGTLQVTQWRAGIIVHEGDTAAPKVDPIYLPVSLLHFLADLSNKLNNESVTISPFINAVGQTFLGWQPATQTYQVPTWRADNAVASLVLDEAAPPVLHTGGYFTGLYPGSGPTDSWNALIRLAAAMAIIHQQVQESAMLVDDASKTAAILIELTVMSKIGRQLASPGILGPNNPLTKLVDLYKVTWLADGTPLLSNYVLAGMRPDQRMFYIDMISKLVRFGAGAFSGKWFGDVPFEVGMTALRKAFISAVMGSLVHYYAADVLAAAGYAENRQYHASTLPTLQFVAAQSDELISQAEAWRMKLFSNITQMISLLRGLNGLYGLEQGALSAGWIPTAANLSQLSRAEAYVLYSLRKEFVAGLDKTVGEIGALGDLVVIVGALMVAGDQAIKVGTIVEQVFNGDRTPITSATEGSLVDWAESILAPLLSTLHIQSAHGRARIAAVAPPVSAYLALLQRVDAALQGNNPAAYLALRADLVAADGQLGAYLDRIYDRSVAALPILATGTPRDAVLNLLDSRPPERTARVFLALMLELWAQNPSADGAQAVRDQLQLTGQRVQEAGQAAAAVEPALAGRTLPGTLVIDAGDHPTTAPPGQAVALPYTITNVGDTPVPGGSARFLVDAGLTPVSPLQQSVPPLGPGQADQLVWTVKVAPDVAAPDVEWQVNVTSTGSDQTAVLEDDLTLVDPHGALLTPPAAGAAAGSTPLGLACPADLYLTVQPGQNAASTIVVSPMATGAGVTVVGARSDGRALIDPYPLGTTAITWTATDAQADQESCIQLVTVGTTPPALAVPAPTDGSLFLQELTPASGPIGQEVILHGQGFGDQQGTSVVRVGGRQVPVLFWSPVAIGILMNPQAYDHSSMALDTGYPVQVVLPGGQRSNPVNFLLTSGSPAGQ